MNKLKNINLAIKYIYEKYGHKLNFLERVESEYGNNKNHVFKCDNCNATITILILSKFKLSYGLNSNLFSYYISEYDDIGEDFYFNEFIDCSKILLELSCSEIIIKNIIE